MSEGRPLLLDVNAFLALAWPSHQFHSSVVRRLERRPAARWATCALTQLGFLRLSANPAVVGLRKTPAEAARLLDTLTRDSRHLYLEKLPAPARLAEAFGRLVGHQQVTDAYLLAIAEAAGATLLILDRRLSPPGIRTPNLEQIEL